MTQEPTIWTGTATRHAAPTSFGTIPVVIAEPAQPPLGTVLLVHGRSGAPGQAQIAVIADAYLARGWRVAAPELPNSIALPDSGPPDRVTFSTHTAAALETLDWLRQHHPDQRMALAGHSLSLIHI